MHENVHENRGKLAFKKSFSLVDSKRKIGCVELVTRGEAMSRLRSGRNQRSRPEVCMKMSLKTVGSLSLSIHAAPCPKGRPLTRYSAAPWCI